MVGRKLLAVLFFMCVVFASCGGGGSDGTVENWSGDEAYVSPKNEDTSMAKNQLDGLERGWWESTSFYHIWVKSFADSNRDGCGDLNGIRQNLDYISDLGFQGIWLSPIFECDYKGVDKWTNMHGYDVTDYYAVNSLFGTEEDLTALINACHELDIKIIFDFVPNHSGSGSQWFKDSCENKDGKRDWYVWNSTPLKWNTGMSLSGWTKRGGGYYWHAFAGSQPDLNFRNYEVREEMKNVVRYWLNRGFDGLRVDAVRYLVENESSQVDTAESIQWFQELREELDAYPSPKFMTFEAWITGDRDKMKRYFGSDSAPCASMILDFDQGSGIFSAINGSRPAALKDTLYKSEVGRSYGTFLANHDEYQARLGTVFKGDNAEKAKIHAATALSLLRPTTPFVYYGQEIAMKEDTSYGDGDIRLRSPFDWRESERQRADEVSTYSLNKALIHLRNNLPALFGSSGNIRFLESAQKYDGTKVDKVAAYTISSADGKETLLCVANISKYQWNDYAFSDGRDGEYTLLMARSNDTAFSLTDGRVVFKNLYPYEIRVYYSGSALQNPSMIFTETYLTKGEDFEGEVYLGEEVEASRAFYLRGDMNGWGVDTPMKYDGGSGLWGASVSLSKKTYEFKLDKGGNWKNAYGYDKNTMPNGTVQLDTEMKIHSAEGSGSNLSFSAPSAGEYIFRFNEKTSVLKITK